MYRSRPQKHKTQSISPKEKVLVFFRVYETQGLSWLETNSNALKFQLSPLALHNKYA